MSENDRKVPLIIRDFHMKSGMCDLLSSFKREDFKVSYLKFWEWSLGRKVLFSIPWGQPKFPPFLKLSVHIQVVLLINLNYTSTLIICEVIKFYNLGNKTFETDFSNC